jgi:putative ABC transport system substrate-binding protein
VAVKRIFSGSALAVVLLLVGVACAPAAPTPTTAPPKATEAPAAKPAAAPTAPAAAAPAQAAKPVPADKVFNVGVFQFVTHPALDDARKGAIQALTDAGFKEGENIKYDVQNGQRDMATVTSIAQRFRDQNVDLMIAVGTQPLQGATSVTKDSLRPVVVFNTVTDPYAAAKDVIRTAEDRPDNVTGLQALPPVKEAMQLVQAAVPGARKFGIIWTPAEANSVVATGLAREAATELNIELIEQTVSSADEVLQASQSLLTKNIDVFFVSTDSTVVSALESVVKVANENKKPLFGNDPASASRGAVAALGIDYYDQGYESGQMAAQILKGEKLAKDVPIEKSKKSHLAINLQAAQLQGVTLTEDILKQAKEKFETIVPAKPKS